MKLNTRILFAIPCLAAFLAVTGSAHASIISGTVWENQAPYTGAPLGPPSGTAAGTFNIDGINFNSNGSTDYAIGSFLTSGGNVISNASGGGAFLADGLNNTIFEFTGTSHFDAGTTYTVRHDDGAYLFLNNGPNVLLPFNSGTPTAAEDSTFTVATSGDYSFLLEYTEINNFPAVLSAPSLAQTPEPSSIVLLGSGLLGIAGLVRRRMGV